MNDFELFTTNALDETVKLIGSSFTYKGIVYKGIVSPIELSTEFTSDGLLGEVFTTSLIVKKSILPTTPKSGETLYLESIKGRVMKVDDDGISYIMAIQTATK